ncbi:MAG TPA: hypothetical protein VIV11_17990 [Kofleriaceae bacterium]
MKRALVFVFLVVLGARAQAGERVVGSELALDGAVLLNLRGALGIARAGESLDLAAWADVAVAAGNVDAGDTRARLGARARFVRAGRFELYGSLALVRRATTNTGFAAQTLATDLVVQPSVRAGRVLAGVELGVEQAWLAYIAPSDTYRELVYAMAEPGWYALPARTVRVGATASLRLGSADILLRGGYARSGALDFLPQLYVSLGAGYRF